MHTTFPSKLCHSEQNGKDYANSFVKSVGKKNWNYFCGAFCRKSFRACNRFIKSVITKTYDRINPSFISEVNTREPVCVRLCMCETFFFFKATKSQSDAHRYICVCFCWSLFFLRMSVSERKYGHTHTHRISFDNCKPVFGPIMSMNEQLLCFYVSFTY